MKEYEFTELMSAEQVALFQLCLALTTLEQLGYSLYFEYGNPPVLCGEEQDHELLALTNRDDGVTRWGYRTHEK